MDEARRVLARLERIEALTRAGADPRALIEELRALLEEGEAWVVAEGAGAARAGRALAALGNALAGDDAARGRAVGRQAPREEVVAGRAAV